MKYIDADKLKAEIKGLQCEQGFDTGEAERAYQFAIKDILASIDSLQQEQSHFADASKMEQPESGGSEKPNYQQQEVDLEKALNGLDNAYYDLDGIAVKGATYYLTVNDLKDIARDFYELGLNARNK